MTWTPSASRPRNQVLAKPPLTQMIGLRIIPCTHCGSEGRLYSGHPNDPNPCDEGGCPVCEGTGGEIIETESVELADLALPDSCPDCGVFLPLLYPCNERTCPNREIKNDN